MKLGAIALALLAALLVVVQGGVEAKTILVPQDHSDLEEALRGASYGDTVLVAPGRYKVQTKVGSGVVLISTDGPDSTVLWNQRWHILRLMDCDMATVVSGFTFEGRGSNACFACTSGAPTILDNVIKGSWDGLNLSECNALIQGNTIKGCNRGAHIEHSDPEFIGNDIRKNGDGISMIQSSPLISRCTFEHNGRALLILGHSYPPIGGSLETANNFLKNGYTVYNTGLRIEGTMYTDQKEVAIATHNYWGSLCPETKFRGDVVYRPWTDAEHETLFEKCPEEAVPEGTD